MMNLIMNLKFADYAADTRRAIDTMRAQEVAVEDYCKKYIVSREDFPENTARVKMHETLYHQANEKWFERMADAAALIERDEAAILA